MSITKSYNKYNNTYYAYETSYEWDESKKKKVQKRRCIGQFDPVTGEVIPNGRAGRPVKPFEHMPDPAEIGQTVSNVAAPVQKNPDLGKLISSLEAIENSYNTLASQYHDLSDQLRKLSDTQNPED